MNGRGSSRAKDMRAARRAAQFAKFRVVQLNLVPLVDTFVSIVFFALTTSVAGELAPIVQGVTLPEARVGSPAFHQLTLGVGRQVTIEGVPVMNTVDAARSRSNNAAQPLLIPGLYSQLVHKADSIRTVKNLPKQQSLDVPLAIQADKTMRYDLLARVMQTARLAGFRNLSLQVNRGADAPAAAGATS
ncbi:MAG: ExbD/TolR family protein [Gemmatimonadaceae bacterium]